jgi:S-adenosylmethionine synthetase
MMILMKNQSCLLKLKKDIILIPRIIAKYPAHAPLFNDAIKYHINPTGKFVIGGPHGTQDLREEKIVVVWRGARWCFSLEEPK